MFSSPSGAWSLSRCWGWGSPPRWGGWTVLTRTPTPTSPRHASDLLVLSPNDSVGQHFLQPGSFHQHHHRLLLPLRGGRVHRWGHKAG